MELEPDRKLEPEPKPESKPVPTLKHREHSLKSCEEFLNEFTNAEKNIKKKIFRNYFKYENSSSLLKYLFQVAQNKNVAIEQIIINESIKLMEDIKIKEIPENKNPEK